MQGPGENGWFGTSKHMFSKPAVPAAQGLQLQSSNSTVVQVNNSSRPGSPAPAGA